MTVSTYSPEIIKTVSVKFKRLLLFQDLNNLFESNFIFSHILCLKHVISYASYCNIIIF